VFILQSGLLVAMKPLVRRTLRALILLTWLLVADRSFGFALLGPFEPWMDTTNGFRQSYDIGGPMNLNAGYRWNVPTLTYGFDQSFLDYFGTNGVAAVESAVAIWNALPPASAINLTNYPLQNSRVNLRAEAENLLDLKSFALGMLIEQFGLAQPPRYVFALRQWTPAFSPDALDETSWPADAIPTYIIQRNFDPLTFATSRYVNGLGFTAYMIVYRPAPPIAALYPLQFDPQQTKHTAVADYFSGLGAGIYFSGLTRDDVGGLRYLLNATNRHMENLIAGVRGSGSNINNFVNTALRPGVEKIILVPQPRNAATGLFLPLTNQFTDTFITNNLAQQQGLERVTVQPDILFSGMASAGLFARTGTSNWLNHAGVNGIAGGAGPGVICPPVVLRFDPARQFGAGGNPSEVSEYPHWATFDSSTNYPVVYPLNVVFPETATARIYLDVFNPYASWENLPAQSFEWPLPNSKGTNYLLQTSTNCSTWVVITNFVNSGLDFNYRYSATNHEIPRFFRFTPAP
jgi:hypothetical protein